MKTYTYIYTFLLIVQIFILTGCDEGGITFKPKYNPNTTYQQVNTTITDMTLLYEGNEDFLLSLDKRGMDNPMKSSQTISSTAITTTGEMDQHGEFPFTIEFTTDNLEQKIPKGTKILGKNIINKPPKFIAIESPNMSETMKETLLNSMTTVTEQVNFPDKKIKKGESFTQEIPLSIPVDKANAKINMITFYKLMELNESTAEFYINIKYDFGIESERPVFNFDGNGQGSGRLIYDIKNSVITYHETDTEMTMTIPIDGITVTTSVKANSIQETKIISN